MKPKILRVTTVPESLKTLLKGQLKFMSNNGFDVIGVSSGGKSLYEVKQNEGIEVFEIEMSRKITPIKDLKSLLNLYKLIKKEKPTIVHSHTPKAGIIAMLAAKIANVPIRLHTVAGLPLMETKGLKRKLLIFVEKVTYACATKVYPNSHALATFIIQKKIVCQSKVKVLANGSSNGIDTDYFKQEIIDSNNIKKLKELFGICGRDFVFVFVGRLVADKGINELIQAFIKLDDENLKLLLVGDYEHELDPLLESTHFEINNNSKIISVGYQSDIRPYLCISSCLVFPSYREGFPNVVMQSGAMGLPSIVTNINGCNEIIEEGFNGTIIPVKDAEALHNAMSKMIKHPDRCLTMAKNARNKITSNYNQQLVWQALLTEYLLQLNNFKKQNV
jgi:glycosyltransferase involved in cell wall biosynthesis